MERKRTLSRIVPPFSRYAVMPVARKVWQQVEQGSTAPQTEIRSTIFCVTRRRLRS